MTIKGAKMGTLSGENGFLGRYIQKFNHYCLVRPQERRAQEPYRINWQHNVPLLTSIPVIFCTYFLVTTILQHNNLFIQTKTHKFQPCIGT